MAASRSNRDHLYQPGGELARYTEDPEETEPAPVQSLIEQGYGGQPAKVPRSLEQVYLQAVSLARCRENHVR
jgi:hypothetical protein